MITRLANKPSSHNRNQTHGHQNHKGMPLISKLNSSSSTSMNIQ